MSGFYAVAASFEQSRSRTRSLSLYSPHYWQPLWQLQALKWIFSVESWWIRFFKGLLYNLFEHDELHIERADIGIANHEEEGLNRIEAIVLVWIEFAVLLNFAVP